VTALAGTAAADPDPAPADQPRDTGADTAPAKPDAEARPHEIYLEALGKGNLWGLGYHYSINRRFGLGIVASYSVLDGSQRLVTIAPYGSVRILGEHHHHWFADVGPEYMYLQTPSPVMEWSGTSSQGIGGEVSSGYEYRDHFLFRIYGEVVGGTQRNHNIEPWLGSSVGWTF
jgi:hypothetical protein